MRPADLPDRSFVRLKCDLSALLSIITHTANLQEALAVAASDLGAIIVELAIIDIVFMLSVYAEDIILPLIGHHPQVTANVESASCSSTVVVPSFSSSVIAVRSRRRHASCYCFADIKCSFFFRVNIKFSYFCSEKTNLIIN